jgi:hypothetical protein
LSKPSGRFLEARARPNARAFDWEAARDVTETLGASHGVSRVLAVLRNAGSLVLLLRFLVALPVLRIKVSRAPAGRLIASYVSTGLLGVRAPFALCQAVLQLPDDENSILTGRRKQALRTNLRRAREDGLTPQWIVQEGERRELLSAFAAAVPEFAHGAQVLSAALTQDLWLVVFSRDGMPLALLVASVDTHVALLRYLVTCGPATPSTARARYLAHTELVRRLVRERVACLLVASANPLRLTAGLRYFQARLGYRLHNLSLAHVGSLDEP